MCLGDNDCLVAATTTAVVEIEPEAADNEPGQAEEKENEEHVEPETEAIIESEEETAAVPAAVLAIASSKESDLPGTRFVYLS